MNKYRFKILFVSATLLICSTIFVTLTESQNTAKDDKKGFVVQPGSYKALPADKDSELGRIIFERKSCVTCHSVNEKGGCLGPPLDGIGAYRNKDFILARITYGQAAMEKFYRLHGGQAELMPHPRLPAKDAELVTHYLLTLSVPSGGFYILPHAENTGIEKNKIKETNRLAETDTQMIKDGRKLFYEHGCTACHSIGNIGGHFAPALDDLSKYRTEEFVKSRITNAEFFSQNHNDEYQERGTIMPPSNLTEEEIDKISKFLMSIH